jgi:hypothetical protein
VCCRPLRALVRQHHQGLDACSHRSEGCAPRSGVQGWVRGCWGTHGASAAVRCVYTCVVATRVPTRRTKARRWVTAAGCRGSRPRACLCCGCVQRAYRGAWLRSAARMMHAFVHVLRCCAQHPALLHTRPAHLRIRALGPACLYASRLQFCGGGLACALPSALRGAACPTHTACTPRASTCARGYHWTCDRVILSVMCEARGLRVMGLVLHPRPCFVRFCGSDQQQSQHQGCSGTPQPSQASLVVSGCGCIACVAWRWRRAQNGVPKLWWRTTGVHTGGERIRTVCMCVCVPGVVVVKDV